MAEWQRIGGQLPVDSGGSRCSSVPHEPAGPEGSRVRSKEEASMTGDDQQFFIQTVDQNA